MYKLYYYPGNANLAAHICLAAIGEPYELAYLDRDKGAHKSPEYLKINPTGRIPALVDGDAPIFESVACVQYLAAKHPDASLAPVPTDAAFPRYLSWLSFLNNTMQPTVLMFYYADRYAETESGSQEVKRKADLALRDEWDLVEAALGETPYFLGNEPTALDYFLFMIARFSRRISYKPGALPKTGALLRRLDEHPIVVKACEAEGLERPYFDMPDVAA
ncbi:MAG: glutathione S-transferase family protein [Pseudomonadota bacterium]